MKRIENKFSMLKEKNEKGLITFITAGDPDIRTTESLVLKMEEMGADIIELGIPFSDPLADGPVIQKSHLRALSNGTSLKKIINMIKRLREKTQIPIVLMSSYNLILCYNEEFFVADAVLSGVDGIIVPDLPPEEGLALKNLADKRKLDMIFLIAPTSNRERISCISTLSSGFIYYVSLTGVTGEREKLPEHIKDKLSLIKSNTNTPVAVGFGISKPEHIKALGSDADGVIVGSALVRIIEANLNNKSRMMDKVGVLISSLKQGCRNY